MGCLFEAPDGVFKRWFLGDVSYWDGKIIWDLMGFNGLYVDLLGFNGIEWALMGFNGI